MKQLFEQDQLIKNLNVYNVHKQILVILRSFVFGYGPYFSAQEYHI